MLTRGWGRDGGDGLMGTGLLLGVMRMFRPPKKVMVARHCERTSATGLSTQTWLIVYYVGFFCFVLSFCHF